MPEIIKFDDPVVLVGGGELDEVCLQKLADLPIVAADGGANLLRALSVVPSVVIGDLDSVEDKSYWQNVSRVVELAEQDSTDFEKCLYTIEAPYFIALGFTGNRLDHTLAALHVMQKYHLKKRMVLVSKDDVLLVSSIDVELRLPIGVRVSVYPLSQVTFKSSVGLLYPLDNLTMQTGVMIGTSNVSTETDVRITPGQKGGCYAVMLPASEFDAVVELVSRQVPVI